MSDESLKQSEDVSPVDPFEAELVAYLDGELDEDAARRVEGRLAADPAARARAAALKKTFDLLDYLPKPDPSPTFTTRTLDKIPALRSGSRPVVLASPSHPIPSVQAAAGRTSPPLSASTSAPIALSEELPRGRPAHPHRSLTWPAGLALALVALIAIGYLGAIALRPYLFPPVGPRDPVSDDLTLADHRLIEDLPLYAAVDDYEFVERLADSGIFANDAMPAVRQQAAIQTVEPERPGTPGFIALARAFKSLPPERQETIRDIDRRLYAQPQATRDRLYRVLEAYAVWLDRLPEPDRNGVLGAATPVARIGLVREIRERQWIEVLPAAQRDELTKLDPKQKDERIRQWKADFKRQGDQWAFVRRSADAVAGNKVPWPFDTSAGRRDVIEFVRVALRTDDPKTCRMTSSELNEYRTALSAAEKNGAWAAYGKMVYDLDNRHESFPEPASPKLMYTDFAELPGMYSKITDRTGLKRKLAPLVGKWPDFPLELHDELRLGKLGPIQLPPLGPARLSDFKEPARSFIEKEVLSKLTQQERSSMRFFENRWPDYPRRIIDFAKMYDVSIPGVMLPGPPRMWEATYGSQVRPMRK